MSREDVLLLRGEFTWNFGQEFFIETAAGNFVWSDPSYGGTNEVWRTTSSYEDWIGRGRWGRDKGTHSISGYCGDDVKVVEEPRRP